MRTLALGLAAAASLAFAVPASAQTVYVNDGYWGGSGYGYWGGGPRAEIVVGAPRGRVYIDEDGPRYRRAYRGAYAYDGYDAYAYSGSPYRAYAYGGYP